MNLQDERVQAFIDGCFNAGIKDPVSFLISKRPQVYDWLRGIFSRKVLPTDIDGEVEICGNFLRLEFKHESALRNGFLPKGQLKALERLQDTKRFTIVFVGIDDLGEPSCRTIFYHNGKRTPLEECNKKSLREELRKWNDYAEKHSKL